MKSPLPNLSKRAYPIFAILMLMSLVGFFFYRGYWNPLETLPRTALVIPFIPVGIPFMYWLIFRNLKSHHLWVYVASLAMFLLMEGVLYLPYTVFGLGAIGINLAISLGVASLFAPSRPINTSAQVEMVRTPRQNLSLNPPAPSLLELSTWLELILQQERMLALQVQALQANNLEGQGATGISFSQQQQGLGQLQKLKHLVQNLKRKIAACQPLNQQDWALIQSLQKLFSQDAQDPSIEVFEVS